MSPAPAPSPSTGADAILAQALRDSSAWALFLDVDGTLLDIASQPQLVEVPAFLRTALARLHRHLSGALALVSGRPVAELDHLFAPLRLPAAGAHGAHWRTHGEGALEHVHDHALPARVHASLLALHEQHSELLVEDKGSSVALHYREHPRLAPVLAAAVERIVAANPDKITVLPGKAVIEVKRSGFDKACALRTLMSAPPFAGRRPIFIGDDVTDAVALAATHAAGGIALSVERPLGCVDGVFACAADVRAALVRIARQMEEPA